MPLSQQIPHRTINVDAFDIAFAYVEKSDIFRHMSFSAALPYRLESVGILQQRQIGLNKLFVNSRFLKLLTSDSNEYQRFGSK